MSTPHPDSVLVEAIRTPQYVFKPGKWRAAILHFLFEVWSGNDEFKHSITIDSAVLTLDPTTHQYMLQSVSLVTHNPTLTEATADNSLAVSNNQLDVQDGLVRFVKNTKIKTLLIRFPGNGILILEKARKYSALFMRYTLPAS